MSQPSLCRRVAATIILIVAGLVSVQGAAQKLGYLAMVGVPPLRYHFTSTNLFVFNPKLFAPEITPVITNSTPSAMAASSESTATNSTTVVQPANTMAGAAGTDANIIQTTSIPKNISGQYYNSVFSGDTASDMLPVTPQMITQYLKPEHGATNRLDQPGAVVFVPAGIQFTPPDTRTMTGSRATYQTP